MPAALNGIVGAKPSRGLLSNSGMLPACRSLDCVSVFARDVASAALVVRTAAGYDPTDPYSRVPPTVAGPRAAPVVGVPGPEGLDFCGDKHAEAAWHAAIDRAAGLGWRLEPIDLSPFLEAGRLLYGGPWVAERHTALAEWIERHPEAIDPAVARVVSWWREYSAADAFAAQHRVAELTRDVAPLLAALDALMTPTVPTTFTHDEVAADPIGRNTAMGLYTTFANLLDLAAIAVPAGMRADGLPWGVSLLGPHGSDERLTALAGQWTGETLSDAPPSAAGSVALAVVGAHLSGEPLNHQLVDLGATLLETTRTAPDYRLFALPGSDPAKPGLVRDETGANGGRGIEVELWDLSHQSLGRLMAAVPAPLAIGTLTLADGRTVKGFLCEPAGVADATDITAFGGWRAYRMTPAEARR